MVAPEESPLSNLEHAARRIAAKQQRDSAPFRDLRKQHRDLQKSVRRQSAQISAMTLREERLKAAALLALHEGLPELPNPAQEASDRRKLSFAAGSTRAVVAAMGRPL